jgi:translation initiation factor IF-2
LRVDSPPPPPPPPEVEAIEPEVLEEPVQAAAPAVDAPEVDVPVEEAPTPPVTVEESAPVVPDVAPVEAAAPAEPEVFEPTPIEVVVDRPKPAGRKVRKLQEREHIEQGLADVEEEKKPEVKAPVRPEQPSRPGPDRTRTYRFHKRGGPRTTMRRKTRSTQEIVRPTGPVDITLPISIKDLSHALGVKIQEILKALMQNGVRATINARLDRDTVDILALEFDREINITEKVAAEQAFLADIEEEEDRPEDLAPRAPVVAMLGHVDHGKTSLLDYIRKTDVAGREAGGITQHISSYKIKNQGQGIVFIDLPGHEAFTHMRGRGAQITDLIILVVAAEEGVMPQTEECINHAKAAEVPVIVALNKCDKPEANPGKVKQLLTSFGVIAEEWGGETIMVETSAITGKGIPELLEAISLQAEVLEYQGNAHKKAIGAVLEAEKSEGRGVLATILVKDGTLRTGDVMLAGTGFGRIRDIRNDRGETIPMAGPSTPVEISGLSEVPEAGDRFYVVDNLARAKTIAEERARTVREDSLAEKQTLSLADLFRRAGETETNEVPIIVKGDTKGSVEAITLKLASLATDEVKIKVLHGAVGSVNESDVQLASASEAIILGFSVVAEERARSLAHERGVDIRYYEIIYELVDDVKLSMESHLAPEQRESILGHANVRAVFRSSRLGKIAGCNVTDGIIRRNARARVSRDGKVIHARGRIDSLRRFKDDVKEVREGFECGLKVSGYDNLQEGDVIEVFEVQEFARTLEDAAAQSKKDKDKDKDKEE